MAAMSARRALKATAASAAMDPPPPVEVSAAKRAMILRARARSWDASWRPPRSASARHGTRSAICRTGLAPASSASRGAAPCGSGAARQASRGADNVPVQRSSATSSNVLPLRASSIARCPR
jgi:hypothetical protein